MYIVHHAEDFYLFSCTYSSCLRGNIHFLAKGRLNNMKRFSQGFHKQSPDLNTLLHMPF